MASYTFAEIQMHSSNGLANMGTLSLSTIDKPRLHERKSGMKGRNTSTYRHGGLTLMDRLWIRIYFHEIRTMRPLPKIGPPGRVYFLVYSNVIMILFTTVNDHRL